jgi:lipopolysaccharide/colanic/teichoic acid biosynthesis glycosyltransferase
MKTQSALTQESIHIDPNYLQVKRVLDLAFLALMALFILPLVIIIAVMIRLDSRGSVIFRQKRIGLLGAEFNMLKFRSMYGNSDDTIHREAARQFMNGYTLSDSTHNPYKLGDDPRITRVGRFLRKTSLD